jgi:hypothetical protein
MAADPMAQPAFSKSPEIWVSNRFPRRRSCDPPGRKTHKMKDDVPETQRARGLPKQAWMLETSCLNTSVLQFWLRGGAESIVRGPRSSANRGSWFRLPRLRIQRFLEKATSVSTEIPEGRSTQHPASQRTRRGCDRQPLREDRWASRVRAAGSCSYDGIRTDEVLMPMYPEQPDSRVIRSHPSHAGPGTYSGRARHPFGCAPATRCSR